MNIQGKDVLSSKWILQRMSCSGGQQNGITIITFFLYRVCANKSSANAICEEAQVIWHQVGPLEGMRDLIVATDIFLGVASQLLGWGNCHRLIREAGYVLGHTLGEWERWEWLMDSHLMQDAIKALRCCFNVRLLDHKCLQEVLQFLSSC